jgi:hypothetical protein
MRASQRLVGSELDENMSMGAVCFDGRRPLMPQSITAVSDCLQELPPKTVEQ